MEASRRGYAKGRSLVCGAVMGTRKLTRTAQLAACVVLLFPAGLRVLG
jgi:hypothetical protein